MKKQGFIVVGSVFAALFLCVRMCFGPSISSYTSDSDGITCTCNTGVMMQEGARSLRFIAAGPAGDVRWVSPEI